MDFDLVRIAAWIIVVAAVWKVVSDSREGKRKRIEAMAVRAEYRDPATSEARRALLLTRYPALLIEPPSPRYMSEAEQLNKEERQHHSFSLREVGLYLGGSLIVIAGIYVIKYLAIVGFAHISEWFQQR